MIDTAADIIDFLRKGELLCGIALDTKKQAVLDRFGNLLTVYGDKSVGYLELSGGIRFGYLNDTIDEFAILNEKMSSPYTFHAGDKEIYIGPTTNFNDTIMLLDNQGIKWKQLYPTHEFELYLLTEGYVGLVFDKETELLRIISRTNQTKELHKGEFHQT
jgi:hypothetical protein